MKTKRTQQSDRTTTIAAAYSLMCKQVTRDRVTTRHSEQIKRSGIAPGRYADTIRRQLLSMLYNNVRPFLYNYMWGHIPEPGHKNFLGCASLHLAKAARRFDFTRGTAFTSFFVRYLQAVINDLTIESYMVKYYDSERYRYFPGELLHIDKPLAPGGEPAEVTLMPKDKPGREPDLLKKTGGEFDVLKRFREHKFKGADVHPYFDAGVALFNACYYGTSYKKLTCQKGVTPQMMYLRLNEFRRNLRAFLKEGK